MKICPLGTKLFHVGRQTDGRIDIHYEANWHFSQFCGSV